MAEKLRITPKEKREHLLSGAILFTFPYLAHLFVIELLSIANVFRIRVKRAFIWKPGKTGFTYSRHAHSLDRKLFICIAGSIEFKLKDGKGRSETFTLSRGQAVGLPRYIWHEQVLLSEDAELVVLCERPYERDEYIEDWQTFQKIMRWSALRRLWFSQVRRMKLWWARARRK